MHQNTLLLKGLNTIKTLIRDSNFGGFFLYQGDHLAYPVKIPRTISCLLSYNSEINLKKNYNRCDIKCIQ